MCQQEKRSANLWICTCKGYMNCIQTLQPGPAAFCPAFRAINRSLNLHVIPTFTTWNESWEMASDCKWLYLAYHCCYSSTGYAWPSFGSREGYRDFFCEKLPEGSPTSSRANANARRDRPRLGPLEIMVTPLLFKKKKGWEYMSGITADSKVIREGGGAGADSHVVQTVVK